MIVGFVNDNLWTNSAAYIKPGGTETLWLFLKRVRGTNGDIGYDSLYPGMDGSPGDRMIGWYTIDPKAVSYISLHSAKPYSPVRIKVSNVRLSYFHPKPKTDPLNSSFLPIIDEYGQYNKRDWPGKTHTVKDLIWLVYSTRYPR
jgi:hypothetical protein